MRTAENWSKKMKFWGKNHKKERKHDRDEEIMWFLGSPLNRNLKGIVMQEIPLKSTRNIKEILHLFMRIYGSFVAQKHTKK